MLDVRSLSLCLALLVLTVGDSLAAGGTKDDTAPKPRLEVKFPSEVTGLDFSPDGKSVVVVGQQKSWIVTLADGKARPLANAPRALHRVLFTPDGKELIATSVTGKIHFLDPNTGTQRQELPMPRYCPETGRHWARTMSLSPDGKILAAGEDSRVESPQGGSLVTEEHSLAKSYLWNTATGKPLPQSIAGYFDPRKGPTTIGSLCFSPDGSILASTSVEGSARLWDVASGKEVNQLQRLPSVPPPDPRSPSPPVKMRRVSFFPDGGLLVALVLGDKGHLHFAGVASGKVRFRVNARSSRDTGAFSPKGRFLVAADYYEKTLLCWDLLTGHRFGMPCVTHAWQFSPDGLSLAAILDIPRTLVSWDLGSLASANLPAGKIRTLPRTDVLCWTPEASSSGNGMDEVQLAKGHKDLTVLAPRVARLLNSFQKLKTRLQQLVPELNSDRFPRREKADIELRNLARVGEPILRGLLETKLPAEAERRIKLALEQVRLPAVEELLWLSTVELLELNGTAEARKLLTQLVKDIYDVGAASSVPEVSVFKGFAIMNNHLYFAATSGGTNNYELWRSNGDPGAAGTVRVKDIVPGNQDGSYPREFKVMRDPGLNRKKLHKALGGHVQAEAMVKALGKLAGQGKVRSETVATGGRPSECWWSVSAPLILPLTIVPATPTEGANKRTKQEEPEPTTTQEHGSFARNETTAQSVEPTTGQAELNTSSPLSLVELLAKVREMGGTIVRSVDGAFVVQDVVSSALPPTILAALATHHDELALLVPSHADAKPTIAEEPSRVQTPEEFWQELRESCRMRANKEG